MANSSVEQNTTAAAAEQCATITYTIDVKEQVADGLFTTEDLVSYLSGIMKVRNSKNVAKREIEFKDNADSVGVESKEGNIIKKNMKMYIKRFLRNKKLKEFIKVRGSSKYGFSLEYINKVDDAEE